MKRAICLFLVMLMFVTTVPLAIAESAQTTATFTVDTAEGKKDDVVLLNVSLTEKETFIGALTVIMQYDSSKLKLVSHPDSRQGDWMVVGEVLDDSGATVLSGDNLFAAITVDGFWISGTICSVAFKVLEDIPEGGIAPVSILVDTISHCENRTHSYNVTVIEGGVIPVDKSAAKAVDALISSLNVQSLEDEAAVIAAREAYDALTDVQKGYVANLPKLEQAEGKIEELKQIAADKQAAEEVAALIAALNVQSLDDEAAVAAAREAYDALTDAQKKYLSNLPRLEEAEARIEALKTPAVVYGDVNGEGTVTAKDALEILKHIVGKTTLDGQAAVAADVSGNGTIEAVDALNILKFVVGKITQFPVEQ